VTLDKVEVARRQLGTALALFLDDLDPVSVHTLARAGCEIAEHLAELAGAAPFFSDKKFALDEIKALRRFQHQYANAFKHALKRDRKTPRDDAEVFARFSDQRNDDDLFIGWTDYVKATGVLPVEAQAFQLWYFAKYPERLAPHVDRDQFEQLFPGLRSLRRSEQKLRLKQVIETYRRDVANDPKTDKRPLVLP
jgi:hypothetical protein